MAKTVGYMVTWTTYGTWLQGDKRGYIKNGEVLGCNERLEKSNKDSQVKGTVTLNSEERKIVREAVEKEAKNRNVKLHALAVCSNHVHVVVGYCGCSIEDIVRQFKQAGISALRAFEIRGRVWTTGYDKRFCFTDEDIEQKVKYVNGHK